MPSKMNTAWTESFTLDWRFEMTQRLFFPAGAKVGSLSDLSLRAFGNDHTLMSYFFHATCRCSSDVVDFGDGHDSSWRRIQ